MTSSIISDPEKFAKAMENMGKLIEQLQTLLEVFPPIEIKTIVLQGKTYVAICIEKKPKADVPKEASKK